MEETLAERPPAESSQGELRRFDTQRRNITLACVLNHALPSDYRYGDPVRWSIHAAPFSTFLKDELVCEYIFIQVSIVRQVWCWLG
jgi:hypothetical protein